MKPIRITETTYRRFLGNHSSIILIEGDVSDPNHCYGIAIDGYSTEHQINCLFDRAIYTYGRGEKGYNVFLYDGTDNTQYLETAIKKYLNK